MNTQIIMHKINYIGPILKDLLIVNILILGWAIMKMLFSQKNYSEVGF
jgi:hypothetical protein